MAIIDWHLLLTCVERDREEGGRDGVERGSIYRERREGGTKRKGEEGR